jgi:hypothetical protein
MSADHTVVLPLTDQFERALAQVRRTDEAWRVSRDKERAAKRTRDTAIRRAHRAGVGYGTIARELGVTRAVVQEICSQ